MLSAVFVYCLSTFAPAFADDCSPQGRLESVRVERAVDGDTLALTDGRRVRLIGFNAPEKANKGRPAEPLAAAAQTALSNRVAGKSIYLQPGQESHDRYGRLLAHAFLTPQGESVEAAMLAEGWGFQVIVAPNKAHAECFATAEKQARAQRRGVWANTYFKPLRAADIDGKRLGFVRLTGTVKKAELSKAALWLSLDGDVVLRIDSDDLALRGWPVGDAHSAAQWQGKNVAARGWLTDRYRNKPAPQGRQRYVMNLAHPLMVELELR